MTTEQLQAVIDSLKVRIFDSSEAYEVLRNQTALYEQALSRIVELLDIKADETGVKLETIIKAIESLVLDTVAGDDEADAEDGEE